MAHMLPSSTKTHMEEGSTARTSRWPCLLRQPPKVLASLHLSLFQLISWPRSAGTVIQEQ